MLKLRYKKPFLTYYNIVIVFVLALPIKLARIPAGADFGYLGIYHVIGNSAIEFSEYYIFNVYSTLPGGPSSTTDHFRALWPAPT